MTEHQAQQQQQQNSAMLEGIELTAENVEAAVLQFYRSGATQVNYHSIVVDILKSQFSGDAQMADPGPIIASSLVLLLATYSLGQAP